MNRIFLAIIIVLAHSKAVYAQEMVTKGNDVNTLFGKGTGFGGFLEFGAKAGDINGQSGLLVGGSIAAVFSSKVNIGLAGYGLTTGIDANTYDDNQKLYKIDMGYGGLLIEPVVFNKSVVHLTVPMLLGVGGAGLRSDYFLTRQQRDSLQREDRFHHDDSDAFLVVEPGLSMEINLLRNIRLDIGATYRYVYDNDLENLTDKDLSGFTGSVGLKLGWF